jgi:SNF2 family DNA or RNA helicase
MNLHPSKFKTQPLKHQAYYLSTYAGREYFALLCEQGTGKSWMIINEIAQLWESGYIDSVLIIAPNGVHENWTRPIVGQFAQHMPEWVNYKSIAWNSGNAKWIQKEREEFIKNDEYGLLKIYAFNWDALQYDRGTDEILEFLSTRNKVFIAADESDAMKDPTGMRAKFMEKLRKHDKVKYRKIITGTPINNSPFDAFSQFRFLNPAILETSSFRAFKTEYAKTLPANNALIKSIVGKKVKLDPVQISDIKRFNDELYKIIIANARMPLLSKCISALDAWDSDLYEVFIEKLDELEGMFNPESQNAGKLRCIELITSIKQILNVHLKKFKSALNPNRIPIIVERDKDKKPQYKNLDKLAKLIEPYSYRVLRKDCLDLPEKIYETLFFYLTVEQASVYKKAEEQLRIEYEGEDATFTRLVAATKLSQITSGYYLHPGSEFAVRIPGENPKLNLLLERVSACIERREKVIIWARYTTEIDDIHNALKELGITSARYYGKTKRSDRLEIIDQFEKKDELIHLQGEVEVWEKSGLDVFIGNQKAGGTGLTLIAASSVHYFSNSFSYRDRIQSEDRTMRIGQTKDVTYYNYAGIGTIDEYIIECLINKQDVSFTIVDKGRERGLFNMSNNLLTA